MSDRVRHRLEIGGYAAVVALVIGVLGYFAIAGSTYGTLRATVETDHADIGAIKRTIQDPDDPTRGIVPMLNTIQAEQRSTSKEVHDLHEWVGRSVGR